jgi:hypothetical protein
MEARMKEAAKLGVNRALAPSPAADGAAIAVSGVNRLGEAVGRIGDNRW